MPPPHLEDDPLELDKDPLAGKDSTAVEGDADALQNGQEVEIRGFGSFRFRNRAPRKGRNPKTGEKVDVPPKKIPYFKMGKELKALLNGKPSEELAAPNPNPES